MVSAVTVDVDIMVTAAAPIAPIGGHDLSNMNCTCKYYIQSVASKLAIIAYGHVKRINATQFYTQVETEEK